jgi:predicted PurR-regulated permease PerM
VAHGAAPPAAAPAPVLAVVPAPVPEPPELGLPEEEARRIDLWWAGAMVVALALVFLLIGIFSGVAVPVLLSLALAYVLNPAVSFLEKKGLSRTLGASLTLGALGLLGVGAVLYLIPVFREEAQRLPGFVRRAGTDLIPRLEATFGISLPDLWRARVQELGGEATELVKSAGPALAKLLASFAGNTARFVVMVLGLLVVPVVGFFFLRDYPALVSTARGLLPRRAVALVSRRFGQVDGVLGAFVQGQITVGAILSVIYATGLSVARVELAIFIGLVAGFGNMVPYLGTALGIGLAAVGMLLSWQGMWQLGVVAGTFIIAQLLEGFVITPRVVGEKVGLSSVVVILAVLGFGELFGFVGVLLAVPVAAILRVVGAVVVERYRRSPWYDAPPAEG